MNVYLILLCLLFTQTGTKSIDDEIPKQSHQSISPTSVRAARSTEPSPTNPRSSVNHTSTSSRMLSTLKTSSITNTPTSTTTTTTVTSISSTKRENILRKSMELGDLEITKPTSKPTTSGTTLPTTTVDPRLVDIPNLGSKTHSPPFSTTKSGRRSDDLLVPLNFDGPVIGPSKDLEPIPISPASGNSGNSRFISGGGTGVDFPVDNTPRQKVDECYSGFSVVNGETVATGTEKCPNMNDICYNATVTGPMIGNIGKAGCSTKRCQLAGAVNRCVDIEYLGYKIHFCCCDTFSKCNSKYTNMNIIEAGLEKIKDGAKFIDKILDVVG